MLRRTKLSKFRALLEDWSDGKRPLRRPLPPVIFEVCLCVYEGLCRENKAEFITSEVVGILKKCGIESRIQGIGYIAYL